MKKYARLSIAFVACTFASATVSAQTVFYELLELPEISAGIFPSGRDINNQGKVLVNGHIYDIATRTYTALSQPSTSAISLNYRSFNDSGQVVGSGRNASSVVKAFRGTTTSTEFLTDLGSGFRSDAVAVNSSGNSVGWVRNATSTAVSHSSDRPAFWNGTTLTVLGGSNLSTTVRSVATAISDSGIIVGNARLTTESNTRAVRYNLDGSVVNFGVLSGDLSSEINAVNELGVGVGRSAGLTADLIKAVVFDLNAGTITQLARPAGINSSYQAIDINESGVIIANGNIDGTTEGARGLVYKNGTGLILDSLIINSGGVSIRSVTALNDDGFILGSGFDSNGNLRSYLLSPTAVPEPASIAALSIGLLAIARRRKSSKN